MVIGGLQKLSLSDFPGRVAAIVFTRGCNLRCPYCHNPELVDPARYASAIPTESVFRFLSSRKAVLQGVVLTGGEPTLHDGLSDFLRSVRTLGFAVKLDTNGTRPGLIEEIVRDGLADYIAIDIKAPLDEYARVAGAHVDTAAIAESLHVIIGSGVDHEVRTTYSEAFLSTDDLRRIAHLVHGCRRFILQAFRPTKSLDPAALSGPVPSHELLDQARAVMESAGLEVTVR